MKKYLILLKPLDWFFFGGEQTHGEEDTTNYFAKSNILPQQTSLLGMLRYQLLKQHNLLSVKPGSEDVKRMNILIGQSSFNMENAIINKKGNGYGKIKKITPVMLGKMNGKLALPDFYYKMPLDARFDIPSFSVDIKACYNGIVRPMIIHDKNTFNHKTYDNYLLWHFAKGDNYRNTISGDQIPELELQKQKMGMRMTRTTSIKTSYIHLKKSFALPFLPNSILVSKKNWNLIL